jgi:hypothetical protein
VARPILAQIDARGKRALRQNAAMGAQVNKIPSPR